MNRPYSIQIQLESGAAIRFVNSDQRPQFDSVDADLENQIQTQTQL